VLIVGCVGLTLNIISALFLHGTSDYTLHLSSFF
jgi:Co/Zn/Cd efflux system component